MDSYLKSWWDLWAASYDAPGWDAKGKEAGPIVGRRLLQGKNKQEPGAKMALVRFFQAVAN
jgi:hypothetical protein